MFGARRVNGVKRQAFTAAGRKSMPESDLFFVAFFHIYSALLRNNMSSSLSLFTFDGAALPRFDVI